MEPFPEIETARLRLTELHTTDVPRIVSYASNRKISEMTLNIPFPYSEKDAMSWITLAHEGFEFKTRFIFAIRLKPNDEFIGGIGLTLEERFFRGEMGYWIAEPFWDRGLMTEAVKHVIDFGFHILGLNKITATHLEKNPASGKVMMKCGMSKEGVLKEHVYRNAVFHNLIVYGLTRRDYDLR